MNVCLLNVIISGYLWERVWGGQKDVFRLQVTMDNVLFVQVAECHEDLKQNDI